MYYFSMVSDEKKCVNLDLFQRFIPFSLEMFIKILYVEVVKVRETFEGLRARQISLEAGEVKIPSGQEQIYPASTMVKTESKEQSLCCIFGDKQLRAVIIVFLTHSAFSSLSSLLTHNTGVLMS